MKHTDALAHNTTTAYFADGLAKTITEQPNGATSHVTNHLYDAAGQHAQSIDALAQVAKTRYFADGLVRESEDTGQNITRYAYDNAANPTSVWSPSAVAQDATNPGGIPTLNTFTDDNLLATSTVPVAGDGSVRRRTTYGYDQAGRKTSQATDKVNAAGTILETGGRQSFAYYDADRPSVETGRDGATITKTYDPAGNLATAADSSSSTTITATHYLDGLERTVDDGRRTTRYAYDGAGARTRRVDYTNSGGDTQLATYRHGDAGLQARAASTLAGNATADLTSGPRWTSAYDAAGRPATETAPNGQTTTWVHFDDDTLNTQTLVKDGVTLAQWGYTWDGLRRQKTQAFTGVGAGGATPVGATYTYEYDSAGRLKKLIDQSGSRDITWDRDGNRLTYGTQTFSYNADDSLKTAAAPGSTQNFDYTAFGATKNDGCVDYGYDGFDRSSRMTPTAGRPLSCMQNIETSYTYDGLDRQRSRSDSGVPTTDFSYDGLSDREVSETTSGSDLTWVLESSGQQKATHKRGAAAPIRYLATDGQHNISIVTSDASGSASVACTVRFDPFGNPQSAQTTSNPCNTGSADNDALYRGARRDRTTGTYQFGARTYDPAKASFLTPDSYRAADTSKDLSVGTDPLTRNRYGYVNGDPVNFSDPDGHEPRQLRDGSWVKPPSRASTTKDRRTGLTATERKTWTACNVDAYVGAKRSTQTCMALQKRVQLRHQVISLEVRYAQSMYAELAIERGLKILPVEYDRWSDVQRRTWLQSQNLMSREEYVDGIVGAAIDTKLAKGATDARFLGTASGVVIDKAAVARTVSTQRQYRHIAGRDEWVRAGRGGYFNSLDEAQAVVDAFHSGSAEVLGVTRHGDIIVRSRCDRLQQQSRCWLRGPAHLGLFDQGRQAPKRRPDQPVSPIRQVSTPPNVEFENYVVVQVVQALLGSISTNMTAIAISTRPDRSVVIHFALGTDDSEDREEIKEIVGELNALFGGTVDVVTDIWVGDNWWRSDWAGARGRLVYSPKVD